MRQASLGISAFYHDSAACLIVDGKIIAAAHEERFTRIKHDASFPIHAIEYVLKEAGLALSDLSCIVFYDKPFIKFERLLETFQAIAPRGLSGFLKAMPVWIKEKIFLRRTIWKELDALKGHGTQKPVLLFSEHHLSHAASAFFPSPFAEAAVLTIDGVGEWATVTISHGRDSKLKILSEQRFPHSLGLLYSAVTVYCGFKVNSGEYKLMGLSPYGERSDQFHRFKSLLCEHVVDIRNDGSLFLNLEYFDFLAGDRMCQDVKWEKLLGFPPRKPETEITQVYMDLALAIQEITESVVLRLAETAKRLTGSQHLVMAGGVALNCVANGKIQRSGLFDQVWFQPSAGDAGGAMGAAYVGYLTYLDQPREIDKSKMDALSGAYLGPEFHEQDVRRMISRTGAVAKHFENFDDLAKQTANLLSQSKVVGWHQGRMEWGPRALGNRSILADARNPDMQKTLNLKIKYREGFRPFAPAVLEEDAAVIFDQNAPAPYMQVTAQVRAAIASRNGPRGSSESLLDRLYQQRSELPSITHLDGSARLQTVHVETNPRFHQLLQAFKLVTGVGVVVNTSFNVRGEPIVCSPEDAYRCFMRTEMDYLVIGDFLFEKTVQPANAKEQSGLHTPFALD